MARSGLRKAAPNVMGRDEPAPRQDAPLPLAVCLLIWAALAALTWGLVALGLQLV